MRAQRRLDLVFYIMLMLQSEELPHKFCVE